MSPVTALVDTVKVLVDATEGNAAVRSDSVGSLANFTAPLGVAVLLVADITVIP